MLRSGRRRNKKNAPAIVLYTSATNEKGHKQLCVRAQCQLSEHVAGPVWGHNEQSVKRVLATLTTECDCPSRFHKAVEYRGKRILKDHPPR